MFDKVFDLLIGLFDFGYVISVNILTYLVIKLIDRYNGRKKVPEAQKRLTAFICGGLIGIMLVWLNGYSNIILYSFILSLVSWDVIIKPIVKMLKIDYKKHGRDI